MDRVFRLTDVCEWTGPRSWKLELSVADLQLPPAWSGFLRLEWPMAVTYFALRVAGTPAPVPSEDGVRWVWKSHLADRSPLALTVRVDTDSHEFFRQAEDAAHRSAPLTVSLAVTVWRADGDREVDTRHGRVALRIEPAGRMPLADGYLGIDLGNSSTAVAYLPATAPAPQMVREASRPGDTVPSAVQIVRYQPAASPALLDTAECDIGPAAADRGGRADSGEWPVLSPKRSLTARSEDLPLWVSGEQFRVGNDFPAELAFARLFRAFHRTHRQVPRQIAVTCPTTFTAREIGALRRAVFQGWRRSLGATRRTPTRVPEDLPALVLDEASAAALFFINRDFLAAPGGLASLQYLYPNGMTLLVYDCGGGSTDVALVRAEVDRADRTTVRIHVLGRTGLRNFGGDDITAAVFRILKAKLAAVFARGDAARRLPPPEEFSADSATPVAELLAAHAAAIDQVLPTRFDPGARDSRDRPAHANATALWGLAERVKYRISGDPDEVRFGDMFPDEAVQSAFTAGLVRHAGRSTGRAVIEEVAGLVVDRREVNQLINEPLVRSVEQANRLIRSRLGDGDVDRVYLIGNSSRYPAVRQIVRERLNVGFLGERLAWADDADLKSAVAKGAAVAVGLFRRLSGFRVVFEGGYMDRLPFDVGYADSTIGAVRVLFAEASSYAQLTPQLIAVPGGKSSSARRVTLSRRWPGEETFSPFLTFHFAQAIYGPVCVVFQSGDGGSNQFVMQDMGTGAEAKGVELEAEPSDASVPYGFI